MSAQVLETNLSDVWARRAAMIEAESRSSGMATSPIKRADKPRTERPKRAPLGLTIDVVPLTAAAGTARGLEKRGVDLARWEGPLRRTRLYRFLFIARLVAYGNRFSVPGLAQLFEVSTKSVHRDLDFMRNFLGYELTYDANAHTWSGRVPEERIL